jgi:hypothetical protein
VGFPVIRTMPHLPTIGENMAHNPGAEKDPFGGTEWLTYAPATVTRDTAEKHSGAYSAKVTTTSTVTQGVQCRYWRIMAAGRCQTSAWVKGPAGMSLIVGMRQMRASGGGATDTQRVTYTLSGNWERLTSSPGGFPLNAAQGPWLCPLIVVINSALPPAIGTVFWVDDVEIKLIS